MLRAAGAVLVALGLVALPACKRSKHARVSSFVPPPVPAGFAEQSGAGWRIAIPATWRAVAPRAPTVWSASDPQTVDDYHASANIVTEAFGGDSYDFAKANEAGLRQQTQAAVEAVREDVIDGDPTLVVESRWAAAPGSTVAYRTMQAMVASRGSGYVVTCSVSNGAFERYRTTCDAILRSFAVQR